LSFTKAELERYSRQILVGGRELQERLQAAHVLVVGAGGLGSAMLPLLAASGIGKITVFDGDTVERSNLGRQVIFREADIGKNKAQQAEKFLHALNPHCAVTAIDRNFANGDENYLIAADLIFEGSDSLTAKFLVNDLALRASRPALIAALGKSQGHLMLTHGPLSPCYRCVFDQLDEKEVPVCASEGILSTFPSVVGAMAADIGVTFLLGQASPLFRVFENQQCRQVRVQIRPTCPNH